VPTFGFVEPSRRRDSNPRPPLYESGLASRDGPSESRREEENPCKPRLFNHDWSWQETKPLGVTRSYYGVDVFEGAYPYDGMLVTPSWGGRMFEALMPALFVPEEKWAPHSWGVNHPLTVKAQIFHGVHEPGYGYWGFSPSNTPEGGYAAYGVDGIGMNPDGNPSNEDNTLVEHGFAGCPGRDPKPDPPPLAYTNGVVTPHASFLALRFSPDAALTNLERLARDFPGLYGRLRFRDSVNVDSGAVSDSYLSLDQGNHGRAGQRPGRRRPAEGLRRPRPRVGAAAGDRDRAVRG
jgi:hypothetical protein